jgi:uncharacterized protein (DUF488 family)
MIRCYTIGYGNRSFESFTGLLDKKGISLIVDVRSYPYSDRKEFNAEYLASELPKREIRYHQCPRLGGLRKIPYREFMHSGEFKTALDELYELIRDSGKTGIALMCAEKNPWAGHRRFIAEALEKRGVRVIHIIENGQTPILP